MITAFSSYFGELSLKKAAQEKKKIKKLAKEVEQGRNR